MEKILLVDDEPGVLEVIHEVLTDAGMDVSTFTSAKTAVSAIKKDQYDVLITDLQMPEMDGIQLTRKVKAINPEIEVIVITGFASLETALDALKQGVYDYLLKPFNISDVLLTVQKVIENIRLKRQNLELNKKVEKALADLTILHEVSRIINSSHEIDEVFNFALATIESSIELDMITMMHFVEKTDEFIVEKNIGFSDKFVKNFRIKSNQGIIGQAIKYDESVNIAGFENDESYKKSITKDDAKKINCFITIPLSVQGNRVGMITIHQMDAESLDDFEKLKLLEVMSVNLAPMLQLAQYRNERMMMLQDSLYGAKNELLKIVKKAIDYKGTLSILVFKLYLQKSEKFDLKIFDIGDVVFNHILNNIAPIDSALKVGLDSFMVIVQGKTKILTEELAAKIKREVDDDPEMKNNGFLLDYGYADFPMDGQTFEVLISKAQASLWKFVKG